MSDAVFPSSTALPLRGGPRLRWGIVGPGGIADDFVRALRTRTDQQVVAVASRDLGRAQWFAGRYGAEHAVDSVERLIGLAEVDVVYLATPHSAHRAAALQAVAAGKPVLVEKPVALTAAEAVEIREAADRAGVLVMEAMWTRYLPQSMVIAQLLDRGDLGRVRLISADVGWRADLDAVPRLGDPALGGGAVLDMGVYAYWFVRFAGGAVTAVRASGSMGRTGVDEQAVAALRTESGADAAATVTMAVANSGLAAIRGSEAAVRFLDPFVFPARFVLETGRGEHEWSDDSGVSGRDGLAWQAAALAIFAAEGRTDSPLHGWDDAIGTMQVIDEVRRQLAEQRPSG